MIHDHNEDSSHLEKSMELRAIHLLHNHNLEHLSHSNAIQTAHYTFLNFIPKNIFEQFHQLWCLWYLFILLLQLSYYGEIDNKLLVLIPFCILILSRLLSDGYFDKRRHDFDDKLNNREYRVLTSDGDINKKSKDICVGDLILLKRNDIAPSDMIILCTSNYKQKFHVDMTDITGEAQFDIKKPIKETRVASNSNDILETVNELSKYSATIKVPEDPSCKACGSIKLKTNPKSIELREMNYIKSGAKILGIAWIYGTVIYTNSELKQHQHAIYSSSLFERSTNRVVFCMMLLTLFLVFLSSMICIYDFGMVFNDTAQKFTINAILLFHRLVPPSLLLCIKVIQFISILKFSKKNPGVQFNSLEFCEELGQIEYILTDKTGTLTANDVHISIFVLDGVTYLRESPKHHQNENSKALLDSINFSTFSDLRDELRGSKDDFSLSYYFVMCMAICNQSNTSEEMDCNTLSIEDEAMIEASYDLGISLNSRSNKIINLSCFESDVILQIMSYKSYSEKSHKSRIIVKDSFKNEIILYVKGTKSEMLKSLVVSPNFKHYLENNGYESKLNGKKLFYLGYRILKEEEVEEFTYKHRIAKLSPINSEGKIDDIFSDLESGLSFLGIIGLEDKVFDDTKETVTTLSNAGIKFWMLSGDSEENSICAGISAKLVDPDIKMVKLSEITSEMDCMLEIVNQIKTNFINLDISVQNHSMDINQGYRNLDENLASSSYDEEPKQNSSNSTAKSELQTHRLHRIPKIVSQLAGTEIKIPIFKPSVHELIDFNLCVDRTALNFGLSSEENRKYFAILLAAARSVCFYSLLPEDKTKIAKFLRHNFSYSPTFLAIGEGHSDFGMIQEAHIGVGIVNSSIAHAGHLSITRFSQLKELLLFQGRWNYLKMSGMVFIIFFKNFILVFLMFLHCVVGKSYGYELFGEGMIAAYLLFFTMIPKLIVGIFDEDLDRDQVEKYPQVYSIYMKNALLSLWQFLYLVIISFMQAVVIYIPILYITSTDSEGTTTSLAMIEWLLYFIVTGVSLLFIINETQAYNWWIVISHIISIGFLVLYSTLESWFNENDISGALEVFNNSPFYYFYILWALGLNYLILYTWKIGVGLFQPTLVDFVKAMKNFDLSVKIKSKFEIFQQNLEAIYKKTKNTNQLNDTFDLNKITMKFISEMREVQYLDDNKGNRTKIYKLLVFMLDILLINYLIELYFDVSNKRNYLYFMIINILIFAAIICIIFSRYFQTSQKAVIISTRGFCVVILILCTFLYNTTDFIVFLSWPPLFVIGTSIFWIEMVIISAAGAPVMIAIEIYYIFQNVPSSKALILSLQFSVLFISISLFSSFVAYYSEKSNRKRYMLMKKVEIEVEKSQHVLNVVLPAFVRKRVKDGCRYIAEDQGMVTVIFCEVCDFEEIISAYPNTEISYFIDDIYKKFDAVCESTGVTKIETVGKVYMACAGLNDSEQELSASMRAVSHSRRAVEMGLGIISAAKKIRLRKGKALQVKIGIHTGSVVAGVVGFHKPQFSLVGDTVNTASRMASTIIVPDTIQISDETYQNLSDKTGLSFRTQTIQVKGKGYMKTHYVKVGFQETRSGHHPPYHFASMPTHLGTTENHSPKRNTEPPHVRSSTMRRQSIVFSELELEDPNMLFERKESNIIEPVKLVSWRFFENEKEKALRIQMTESSYPIYFAGILIITICNLLLMVFSCLYAALEPDEDNFYLYTIFYAIQSLIFGGLLVFLKNNFKKYWFGWILQFFYLAAIIWIVLLNIEAKDIYEEIVVESYALFMILALNQCSCSFFKNTFLGSILVSLLHIISLIVIDWNYLRYHIEFTVFFIAVSLITSYHREDDLRISFALEQYANKELKKTENLLTQMMPPHVYRNLKEEVANTDTITDVTILYADIAGFTAWSSDHNASEVIGMLSEVYTRFDKKCVENNVYKVHTIGDCYVAIGFVGNESRDPAKECLNVINFAQSLNAIIDDVNDELALTLSMRIGVHTGKIIGGIVGTNIVRYDIYGDDVLVANKMESSGVPGSINVSEVTKNLIESYRPGMFNFELHKELEIDTIGRSIKTFLIISNYE
ncbi:unnamed protein product [Blepharisma stoltei]|uniref:Guanylate cyclase domain-containing protein n=1 Tax=Blepharisma stoltei TaxID=1481888 RepID=A0AAU9J8F4_9CILI|nr:unnamed protein product [Blepharisma stoltei]